MLPYISRLSQDFFRYYGSFLRRKHPITTAAADIHKYFFIVFQRKEDLMFHVNPLLGRGFT